MASCLIELNQGDLALETARKDTMSLKPAMITVAKHLHS